MTDWRTVDRGGQRDTLGEGTLWSARENAVFWVDILAPALNRVSLTDGSVRRWAMPEPIGWVVERRDGGLIAGLQSGFVDLRLDPFAIRAIGDPEPDLPGNRMNDGKADSDGAIWAGTMDMAEDQASGALYRMDADRRWTRMDGGYRITNGPAFSPDGTWLYHTDTGLRQVYRFARHADGSLGAREDFIRFEGDWGYPDGMTCDAQGGLWIAHWGGARVSRFDAAGRLDRAIALPAQQVTNIAFAGAGLDRMFVSSAARGLGDDPAQGALFEVESGATGVAPGLFAG